MAFAVIETGGKQYRVSPGTVVSVEKLNVKEGEKLTFDKVLLYQDSEAPIVGAPFIEGAIVSAEVLTERRGPKIRVFKYKAKKRQRRTMGHRQTYTQVKILDIAPTAPAKKVEKPAIKK